MARPATKLCKVGGVAALCGKLSVAENRARASGRRISLSFAVIPARGAKGREPLFYLAGGPGGSALASARFAVEVFGGAKRDIVLLDQRGIGRSAPLVCPSPAPEIETSELPAFARRCVAGIRTDTNMYGTDAAMDDVDALRAALGYERVVVYGGSYGATAALVYVARHGAHVTRVVLDGGTSPDIPFFERAPLAGQAAIDRLSARCDADPRCVGAFGHLTPQVAETIEQLRANPATVATNGVRVPFGAAEAGLTIQSLSRDPATLKALLALVHQAASGDTAPLAKVYAAAVRPVVIANIRKLMYWRITCFEGWARQRPQEATAAARGTYLEDEVAAELEFRGAFCPALPQPPPEPDTAAPPRSRVPVLALVGGLDPQDPRANIAPLARAMPRTTIVDVPGGGHGSIQYGCLPRVAARFLDTGRVTSADRACSNRVEPPPLVQP